MANPILLATKTGAATFGTWQVIASSLAAEAVARQGFEWILIDTQHGGVSWDSLVGIIQAVEVGGAKAVVRVGWNDQRLIMRALDFGAIGVVVPMIGTGDDARYAVAAMRYPPFGVRSFGPARDFYSTEAANAEVACLLMIETAEGLANVEEIAATPGVDGLFVGPADLALSLGLPLTETMPDQVLEAVDKVVAACFKAGIIAGCVSLDRANAVALLERGVRFITLGADIAYVTQAARKDAELARELSIKFRTGAPRRTAAHSARESSR